MMAILTNAIDGRGHEIVFALAVNMRGEFLESNHCLLKHAHAEA
jgi:hypothetical protein